MKIQEIQGSVINLKEQEINGTIEIINSVNGRIEDQSCMCGKIIPPVPYHGWIDTIDDMEGKIVLPDITDIEIIKKLQAIVYRLVTEVEGNPELAIDGLIVNVNILQQQYSELLKIYYDTTENWNNQPDLITKKGDIYIYSDAPRAGGGTTPRMKIGNGGYLIDLMFVDQDYYDHIRDTIVHITQEEREYWNDKVGVTVVQDNGNQLLFYK